MFSSGGGAWGRDPRLKITGRSLEILKKKTLRYHVSTLSGTDIQILPPKRYNVLARHFYIGVPAPPSGVHHHHLYYLYTVNTSGKK